MPLTLSLRPSCRYYEPHFIDEGTEVQGHAVREALGLL